MGHSYNTFFMEIPKSLIYLLLFPFFGRKILAPWMTQTHTLSVIKTLCGNPSEVVFQSATLGKGWTWKDKCSEQSTIFKWLSYVMTSFDSQDRFKHTIIWSTYFSSLIKKICLVLFIHSHWASPLVHQHGVDFFGSLVPVLCVCHG